MQQPEWPGLGCRFLGLPDSESRLTDSGARPDRPGGLGFRVKLAPCQGQCTLAVGPPLVLLGLGQRPLTGRIAPQQNAIQVRAGGAGRPAGPGATSGRAASQTRLGMFSNSKGSKPQAASPSRLGPHSTVHSQPPRTATGSSWPAVPCLRVHVQHGDPLARWQLLLPGRCQGSFAGRRRVLGRP